MDETKTKKAEIVIDAPTREVVTVTVLDGGEVLARRDVPYKGSVDNRLLTTIDKLFQENILDKFVFFTVKPGPGVDKTSLLYRIIVTLGAALERTS